MSQGAEFGVAPCLAKAGAFAYAYGEPHRRWPRSPMAKRSAAAEVEESRLSAYEMAVEN